MPQRAYIAHSGNPVKDAIDAPFVPNTRILALQPPRKIPAEYLAKLKDLDQFVNVELTSDEDNSSTGLLKFAAEVKRCYSDWPFSIEHNGVFVIPSEVDRKHLPPIGGKAMGTGEVERNAAGRTFKEKPTPAARSKLEQDNVSYMLDVWQRAEDRKGPQDHRKSLHRHLGHDTSAVKPEADVSADNKKAPGSANSQLSVSTSATTARKSSVSTPTKADNVKSLSTSTMRLLKKLARGSEDIERTIKNTLTGCDFTEMISIYSPQPRAGVSISSASSERRSAGLQRKKTYKLKANGGVTVDLTWDTKGGGIVLDLNVDTTAEDEDEAEFGAFTVLNRDQTASVQFTQATSVTEDAQNLIDRLEQLKKRPVIVPPANTASFSVMTSPKFLSKLTSIIQRICKKDPSVRRKLLENGGAAGTVTQIESMADFLDCDVLQNLSEIPEPGTIEYNLLLQTLLLCLYEDIILLRFEAAKLLILINGYGTLSRWDLINFRNTLLEMMRSMSSEERFLAGVTLCKMGVVETKSLRRVKLGLGDLNGARREAAMELLATMDMINMSTVMESILAECENSSWRVRVDVIKLLERWIIRLKPSEPEVPRAQENNQTESNGYLSGSSSSLYSSAELVKRKQGAETEAKLNDIASDPEIDRIQHYIHRALMALLTFMWKDWSPEVRSQASNALLSLGEGKAMFEWIIGLLDSTSPTQRIDALKCLSGLGFVAPEILGSFMQAFKDPYASVRIQACKVACSMVADNRVLINTLLACLDDPDSRVRRYSIRAIGFSKCTEPKIREALHWCLEHELDSSVRLEAVRAAKDLQMLQDDSIKASLMTVVEGLGSINEQIRSDAERILIAAGFISDAEGKMRATTADVSATDSNANVNSNGAIDASTGENARTLAAVPGVALMAHQATRSKPATTSTPQARSDNSFKNAIPESLRGNTFDAIKIFYRDSLVGEAEQRSVIDQVREMAKSDHILQEVERLELESGRLPDSGLDLNLHEQMKFNFKKKRSRAINLKL